MDKLSPDIWIFEEYFKPPLFSENPELDPTIRQAHSYLDAAKIEEHPFFERALGNRDAVALWTAQESVITNLFSQTLFSMMALIKNVHLRSALLPVVAGEHSALKGGQAVGSHPHLLSKLVTDIGLQPDAIRPVDATIKFAKVLSDSLASLPRALGCLGIGNEAMLVPEYVAVESLFSELYPREMYRPFLRANIEEDRAHSALMDVAATASFDSNEDRTEFLLGAREGVDARVRYYDDLLTMIGGKIV